jgi:hypothetical protein
MRFSLLFAVILLCLPQCMRVTDGIEVDVAYQPEATPAQIRTDLGYRVALDRAMIAVGQVELIRCDNFVAELGALFVPARARAHVSDTPTSLGEPIVLDLMESAGTAAYAGTMKPPPGRYCGIRVLTLPADADAVGLTEKNTEMMRHTLLVEGWIAREGDDFETSVALRIAEVFQSEMRFERPLVFEQPIVESLSIRINHTRWFDGIDFASLSQNAVRERITKNVRSSLEAVLPYAEGTL